jgi:hypothetical protein
MRFCPQREAYHPGNGAILYMSASSERDASTKLKSTDSGGLLKWIQLVASEGGPWKAFY